MCPMFLRSQDRSLEASCVLSEACWCRKFRSACRLNDLLWDESEKFHFEVSSGKRKQQGNRFWHVLLIQAWVFVSFFFYQCHFYFSLLVLLLLLLSLQKKQQQWQHTSMVKGRFMENKSKREAIFHHYWSGWKYVYFIMIPWKIKVVSCLFHHDSTPRGPSGIGWTGVQARPSRISFMEWSCCKPKTRKPNHYILNIPSVTITANRLRQSKVTEVSVATYWGEVSKCAILTPSAISSVSKMCLSYMSP